MTVNATGLGLDGAGADVAAFVNLPTRVYDPHDPDKCRLNAGDPRIPYSFQ